MDSDKRLRVTDDDDLTRKARWDTYAIQRYFKYLVLGLLSIVLVCFTCVVLYFICFNPGVRMRAIDQVLNNIPVIIVAALAILGFRDIRQ